MHILIDLQQQLPLNISFSYVSNIFNVFQNSAKHARARLGFAFCSHLIVLISYGKTNNLDGCLRNYSKLVAGHKIHF